MQAALGPDDTTMSFDKGFADSQPQARPAGMLLATMLCPVKTLKHMWQLVGRDARSIIRHRYDHCVFPPLSSDMHFALTIHQRIGDQVVEHHLNAPPIYVYQRQVIRNLHRDRGA